MPFRLSKITVISSSEGIDKENLENKWAFDVNQNNDVFLYIEKNKKNKKEEAIKTIKIENFNITKEVEKGEAKLFKPSPSENSIFNCNEENKIDKILEDKIKLQLVRGRRCGPNTMQLSQRGVGLPSRSREARICLLEGERVKTFPMP